MWVVCVCVVVVYVLLLRVVLWACHCVGVSFVVCGGCVLVLWCGFVLCVSCLVLLVLLCVCACIV